MSYVLISYLLIYLQRCFCDHKRNQPTPNLIICIFISPKAGSRKKQANKKNKDKNTAREIYNTIPVATLRIHYGSRDVI